MAKNRLLILVSILAVVAIGIAFAGRLGQHRLELKSCFDDVQGLKSGAPVRLSGVDVGTVRSVRAEPQNKNCPAEVDMILSTPYQLPVPQDALTSVETAGVLGESLLIVDPSAASGPPVPNYGYLKSKPRMSRLSLGEIVKTIGAAAAIVKAADQSPDSNIKQPAHKPNTE